MNRQLDCAVDTSVDTSSDESVNLLKRDIGRRIKQAREAAKLTQDGLAALASARSKSGLQDNEAGKSMPGGQILGALAKVGINTNWVLTGSGDMLIEDQGRPYEAGGVSSCCVAEQITEKYQTGFVAVALYNDVRAAAGHGSLVGNEAPDDALMFKEDWLRFELGAKASDLCLIRVSGDSMEPTLRGGDVILVNHAMKNPDREGIYILRMGEMLLVKRLQAVPGGKLRVISDNAAFDSWVVSLSDLGVEIAIIGRVVWSGRRM
ncbi:MAG: helix-turn-helix transcriptional regulator [Azonexus sp.]